MVSNDVLVVRMVWHPFHFQDGELLPTAFEKPDLLGLPDRQGFPRYMSVDDFEMLSTESVDWRIEWQQRDGRLDEGRREPKFIFFPAPSLRECTCPDGEQLFDVVRHPTEAGEDGPDSPENPAHCGVHTLGAERFQGLSKGREKVILLAMRTELMKAIQQIREYSDVCAQAA